MKLPLMLAAGAVLAQTPRAFAEVGRWSPDRAKTWYPGGCQPSGGCPGGKPGGFGVDIGSP
ncbi:hypothetical protein A5647_19540 [Mycobacterium sp. 1100029.7]|nr:hypothetical protein A5647_19540 [Mycobacterium sp. 1100029.7]